LNFLAHYIEHIASLRFVVSFLRLRDVTSRRYRLRFPLHAGA